MNVQLLNEQRLEFLSLKGSCTCSSEFTLVKNATLLEITCHGSFVSSVGFEPNDVLKAWFDIQT